MELTSHSASEPMAKHDLAAKREHLYGLESFCYAFVQHEGIRLV